MSLAELSIRLKAVLAFRRLRNPPPVPEQRKPSREQTANPLSLLFFAWSFHLIRTAWYRRLELDDFPLLNPDRSCESMTTALRRNFNDFQEKTHTRRPLLRAIEKTCRFNLRLALFLQIVVIVSDFCYVVPVYFLWRYFMECFNHHSQSYGRGVMWIAILAILQAIGAFATAHAKYRSNIAGAEIKTALVCLISDKSFTIDSHATTALDDSEKNKIEDTSPAGDTGTVFGLMTVDVDRIAVLPSGIITTTRCLLTVPFLAGVMGWIMGWIAAPMIATLLLTVGIGNLSVLSAMKKRSIANKMSDERTVELDNFFQGIRLIKYFGWEAFFEKKLDHLRRREIAATQSSVAMSTVPVIAQTMGLSLSFVESWCIFGSRGDLVGNPGLIIGSVLYALAFRNLYMLNNAIAEIVGGWPAANRVEAFLRAPDRCDHSIQRTPHESLAIKLASALFAWKPPSTSKHVKDAGTPSECENQLSISQDSADENLSFALAPLDIDIPSNELVAIVGPSQCGKTTLLNGLLGLVPLRDGYVAMDGMPSHCPQQAFIQSANVKENIVFGQKYDEEIYQSVIDVCALRPDIRDFPSGDLSELGERGINLSGGQKHRIHLARSIYQSLLDDRKIILLDDPLSAVDAKTCATIFNDAILGLLRNKCRVLVTHQLQVLSRCDRIVYMRHGHVIADGSFDEMMKMQTFANLVGEHEQLTTGQEQHHFQEFDESAQDNNVACQVVEDEELAAQRVPWRLYSQFLGSRKDKLHVVALLFVLAVCQTGVVMIYLQAAYWQSGYWGLSTADNIGILMGLYVGIYIAWPTYSILIQRFCIERSYKISAAALRSLSRAPISFYHSQPIGRLLLRFTHDVNTLDTVLPPHIWTFSVSGSYVIALLSTGLFYVPLNASLLFPWVLLGVIVSMAYKAVPLECKRLSVNLNSKYTAFLHEGLSGRTTISLARYENRFRQALIKRLNDYNSVYFCDFSTFTWASTAFSMSFIIMTFCAGLLIVRQRFETEPALLINSYQAFLILSKIQEQLLLSTMACQQGVNATERMQYFIHDLDQEDHGENASTGEKGQWPTEGSIEFKDVCLQYKPDLPMVLKNVNLSIKGGEKLGIVGRTGAGKSTLLMAILRLVGLADGEILIDGINTTRVGVLKVRHAIATIPQDPVLFVGSIRYNLDPEGVIDDARLNDALHQVHLTGDSAEGREGSLTLDSRVEPGGSNLSSGQKQLLSLARALAKNSKIIIIDEATSNVDWAKDKLIQRTIRRVFADCTILTIAHRLRTVLLYDRICVMDAGQLAELGGPRELFERETGPFRALCDQAGITLKDFM